jgi:uracil-DNA glycosylase family 4
MTRCDCATGAAMICESCAVGSAVCRCRSCLLGRARAAWLPDGGCARCKLHSGVTSQLFGDGDPGSRLLLLGEAPGEQEDRFTAPFVGPAGQLLRKEARKVGVDLGEVDLRLAPSVTKAANTSVSIGATCIATFGCAFWTNVIACRPPNNRQPEVDETEACTPRLDMIMAAIRPRVILVLGAVAFTHLTGKLGITRHRGHPTGSRWTWKGETYNVPVLPTFHPAGLLPGRIKRDEDLVLFRQDIKSAYDLAYPDGWSDA